MHNEDSNLNISSLVYFIGSEEVEKKDFYSICKKLSPICRYMDYARVLVKDVKETYIKLKIKYNGEFLSYKDILVLIKEYY